MAETAVRMPKLADTLVEGTVARWLKRVGDPVAAGEPLCEIETDKVSTELHSPAGGVLLQLVAPEGQPVPIESVIARIGEVVAGVPGQAPEPPPVGAGEPQDRGRPTLSGLRTTSVAARMLAEHGLRPEQVAPADVGHRISKEDVLRHVQARAAALLAEHASSAAVPRPGVSAGWPAASTLQAPSSMRRAIAEHMLLARSTIPHGQTVVEVDLTELADWREHEKDAFQRREGAGLTHTVLFVAAFARALARSGLAVETGSLDLGVAVAVEGGLIVPVLRGVDRLSLGEVARRLKDAAHRSRAGKVALEETRGGVATVSNVGSFGNLTAFPIIPLGQVAILGPGLVERRPRPTPDGGIRAGVRCLLALVYDRRRLAELEADLLVQAVSSEVSTMVPS